MSEGRMMTVWEWVGLVLISYGIIIFAVGIYLLIHPDTRTVLYHLHPNLWWGALMGVSGLALFFFPRLSEGE